MRVWEKETLLNFYATMRTCLVHIRYFTFKLNHEQSLCFGEDRHASQKQSVKKIRCQPQRPEFRAIRPHKFLVVFFSFGGTA